MDFVYRLDKLSFIIVILLCSHLSDHLPVLYPSWRQPISSGSDTASSGLGITL